MNYAFHPIFCQLLRVDGASLKAPDQDSSLWGPSVPLKWTETAYNRRNAANLRPLCLPTGDLQTRHLCPPPAPTSLSLILSFSHALFAPRSPPCLCPPLPPPFSSSCSSSSSPCLRASPSPSVASPAAAPTCGRSPPPSSPSPSLPPSLTVKATRLPQKASVIEK